MALMIDSEQLPVPAARAGVPDAWDLLFRRYQLPLYTYVVELVHDEQASQDIVQETFINAARHIAQLRDDAKFGSWSCRRAWVGLAAVWMVLLALHLAVRDTSPRLVAKSVSPPSANLRVVLAKQQRLRAELLGINLPLPREPRSSAVPGPRSEQLGSVRAV